MFSMATQNDWWKAIGFNGWIVWMAVCEYSPLGKFHHSDKMNDVLVFSLIYNIYSSQFTSIGVLYTNKNVQSLHNTMKQFLDIYTVEPLLYDHPQNHIGVVV